MYIIVETFNAHGEPSNNSIRVRALPGQGFPTSLKVTCSENMRYIHPVGTLFKLWVTPISRLGTPYLYSNYRDPWQAVTREEAKLFISSQFGSTSNPAFERDSAKARRPSTLR